MLHNQHAFRQTAHLTVRIMSTDPQRKQYEFILTSHPADGALNTLSTPLFTGLDEVVRAFDDNDSTRALVLTGSRCSGARWLRVWGGGRRHKEMKHKQFSEVLKNEYLVSQCLLATIPKPIIASVSGYGVRSTSTCMLWLCSDGFYSSVANASSHSCATSASPPPEISIGDIPGGGGTQLTLTGRNFSTQEASDSTPIAVPAGKEAVNPAYEHTLNEGLRYERRLFHSLFGTKDQKEGEYDRICGERKPNWTHS
ncbi:ClpP/crotonase [Pilatotrama ljubarskyi]|nr:ClpP/crotonase [Pilatotrama ljubarskyi]